MVALCCENVIGRTEFVQLALNQLMEYLAEYATLPVLMEEQRKIKIRRDELRRTVLAAAAAGINPAPDVLERFPDDDSQEDDIGLVAAEADEPTYGKREGD